MSEAHPYAKLTPDAVLDAPGVREWLGRFIGRKQIALMDEPPLPV